MDKRKTYLTPRQWEVLALKAMGYSNATTSHALGNKEPTTKGISVDVVNKLCASNMTHAVYLATKAGII